jgi:2-oxoglutarate dehydrogenase E2 component (dihydrolipoamide succinyltransferase)
MPIIELTIPSLGESISSVTLSKWLKPDGSTVTMDEPIAEIETEKANQEIGAEKAGKLIWAAKEGQDLNIGDVYARIDTDGASASAAPTATAAKTETPKADAPKATEAPAASSSYATGHPSPAAGKVLAEAGISPAQVQGTGVAGRITKDDAEKAANGGATSTTITVPSATITVPAAPAAPATPAAAPKPALTASVAFSRVDRTEKMSRMRRTIARRLVSAKNNTAMLTTFNEVDMQPVMQFREKYQEAFVKKYGIKLGFMSIFAKACAKVLLEMPNVNAFIDGDDIIYHDYADVSIAISTPTGLVVPPIKNVESLKFSEVETKLKELAVKAKEGKLSLDEMSGGTFTITNGGVFGSLMSTPIINEPQSAILGMHAIKERPVVVDGQIVIRPMMYLALSYDHRVIDGSTSVTFLVRVKELIEDPTKLLLDI